MSRHRYLHFDVFTRRPLAGNQLTVFPHVSDLDADLMQRVALEMAFPETTFVLPRQDPTIGSTFALAREGFIGPDRDEVVFQLGVGPTPVSLEWAGRAECIFRSQPRVVQSHPCGLGAWRCWWLKACYACAQACRCARALCHLWGVG